MENSVLRPGVIGLGIIGGGIAVSLMNRGHQPVVYDIMPQAYDKWNIPQHQRAASVKELAQAADIVMVAVFNAEQAYATLQGPDGLLENLKEGSVVVLLSTVSLKDIETMYAMCREKGIGFLDSGVSPGSLADKNGLIALTGGDPDVIEKARPILQDWAKEVVACGRSGAGMVAKVARNMITYDAWRITTEAARVAISYGVDLKAFIHGLLACDTQQPDLIYNLIIKRAGAEDYQIPPAAAQRLIPYIQKDLSVAAQMAAENGVSIPVTEQILALVSDTVA